MKVVKIVISKNQISEVKRTYLFQKMTLAKQREHIYFEKWNQRSQNELGYTKTMQKRSEQSYIKIWQY